ncbi:MAG: response regulator [Ignavibacteria bacterium]|jgi:two-component system chemotaxis response regulator CheY|nr:response regulator [Ignavibacteria bacterium]
MKSLIIEDDYITSQVMQEILLAFGEADIAEDGFKGLELFTTALVENKKYDVIFLDIMMPELDGQEVLAQVRRIEEDYDIYGLDGVKIIMTTALDDFENIKTAFKNQCEGYIVKPIEKDKIVQKISDLDLI